MGVVREEKERKREGEGARSLGGEVGKKRGKNCKRKTQNVSSISLCPSPRLRFLFFELAARWVRLRSVSQSSREPCERGKALENDPPLVLQGRSVDKGSVVDRSRRRRREIIRRRPKKRRLRLSHAVNLHIPCLRELLRDSADRNRCARLSLEERAASPKEQKRRSFGAAPSVDWRRGHRRRSRLSLLFSCTHASLFLSLFSELDQQLPTAIVKARDLRSKGKAELEGQVRNVFFVVDGRRRRQAVAAATSREKPCRP